MPSPVRYPVVVRVLNAKGYFYARTNGSHHIFKKPGVRIFSVPVHNNMVHHGYIRQIEKLP